DALVGLRDLLAGSVVRHQGLHERGNGEAADRKALQAVHEIAACDFAVNEEVVKLNGFARQFRSDGFHNSSFRVNISPDVHLPVGWSALRPAWRMFTIEQLPSWQTAMEEWRVIH